MDNLVHKILTGDLVSATDLFEDKMSEIKEKKLLECKKIMVAESFGGRSPDELRKKGYVRASDVLPDPREGKLKKLAKSTKGAVSNYIKKKQSEKSSDDLRKTFNVQKSSASDTAYKAGHAIGRGIRTAGKVAKAALSLF
jgi:hypothetical protein